MALPTVQLIITYKASKNSSLFGMRFFGRQTPFSASRRIEDGKDGQILVSQMGGGMTDAASTPFLVLGFLLWRGGVMSRPSFGDGCQEVGNYRYEHAAREMPWGGGMRMDREDARRRTATAAPKKSIPVERDFDFDL